MASTSSVEPGIAIVGAGFAGASCAEVLHREGLEVRVFEKARGAGGRTSVRRTDESSGGSVDLGAQYFTVRNNRFAERVERWINEGVVAEWPVDPAVIEHNKVLGWDRNTTRYVGVPGMNSPVKDMLTGIPCSYSSRVEDLTKRDQQWILRLEDGSEVTPEVVVLTPPPAQCAELLGEAATGLAGWLSERTMQPTWCYYCRLETLSESGFDAGFVNDDSPLDWVARNNSKPGRDGPETWLVHADHHWSRERLEASLDEIRQALSEALLSLLEISPDDLLDEDVHRWRYAKPDTPLQTGFRREGALYLVGDWLNGSRVEGAFLSGRQAADQILQELR